MNHIYRSPTPSKNKKPKATPVKAGTSAQESDEDPFVVAKSPAKKMRKTPKAKRSKPPSKVKSKKTEVSDSSSHGSSDEMDVELESSSPLSKKNIDYGEEFDKSM
ncbi:hypothetical protein K443DRAFT_116325 [Laccaria amethystina LaAM-08-1]|uniref:Uncharacterized protein n=1 Tax=Laccaria amethystina LaAM-08-1 TaxID=1095629 RepID=A0A0C9WZ92_9AGAR|nr:hypothetical protein K443DRAFT_116325 [Laccaria amethystina LaAM-08-1]